MGKGRNVDIRIETERRNEEKDSMGEKKRYIAKIKLDETKYKKTDFGIKKMGGYGNMLERGNREGERGERGNGNLGKASPTPYTSSLEMHEAAYCIWLVRWSEEGRCGGRDWLRGKGVQVCTGARQGKGKGLRGVNMRRSGVQG